MKKIIILSIALILILQSAVSAKEYIVKPKDDAVFLMDSETELEPFIPDFNLYTTDDISVLNDEQFEFIEEDAPVELFDTYDYGNFMTQYAFNITGIKEMWDIGVYGKNIRVGVIDSGCNKHIALKNNLLDGADFAYDSDTADTSDNIGHGTAVCGIIAAEYGFGKVIGTAHKTNIIPLKFIDLDSDGNTVGGTTKRLVDAIKSAVDDFQCDVINMSCGTIDSNSLKMAVDYAVSKGVIIVAAVGNDGNSKLNYPAAYDNVIGVGSVNASKKHSSFSNTNGSVLITAPGENINVLSGASLTSKNNGTSFSAPYVSGIIANMREINPEMDTENAIEIISNSAEDLGDDGYDETFGYGLIRADAVIDYMLSECECFVSGIDECSADEWNEVRFRFNGDRRNVYFAEYIAGTLNQIAAPVKYVSDNTVMLRLRHSDGGTFRYFVWDGMKPIEINSKIK